MNKGTELTGKIGHVSKIMERELEGLERLAMPDELHDEECKKAGVELTEDYDLIKEALLELKSIKEADPSEASELVSCLKDYLLNMVPYYDWVNDIEKYILKAQEQEKVIRLIFKKRVNTDELLSCIHFCNTDSEALEEYNHKISLLYDDYWNYQLTQEEFEFISRLTGAK